MVQSELKLNKPPAFDLLRLPLIGRLLHWKHARTLLQIPLFVISVAGLLPRRRRDETDEPGAATTRVAILVPAHNEEANIASTSR